MARKKKNRFPVQARTEILTTLRKNYRISSEQMIDIVAKALEEPVRQIALNCGLEGSVILDNILKNEKADYGFDAYNEVYCNMFDEGIVDPTKVTRSALQNAASVAATVLTTESLVADIKDPSADAAVAAAAMNQMGGMGGGMY